MPQNALLRDFFILSTRKPYVFSEMYSSQKNLWKFVIESSQNILKSLV